MRRGSPPEWRRVGGSKVQSVLEMHLARFRTPNGGYDPAAFDREATEQLSMIRPETIIRLHVDSTLPCQE